MGKTQRKTVREHKERLFKLVFREKKDLLALYNAVNGTDYKNPEALEINTLEDIIYMGMRNDTSFLIENVLNLYEHQSTFSPNYPLRGLLYFAELYREIIGDRRDMYSSRQIELPYPQYIVFYNGEKNQPERSVMYLSDAYPKLCSKDEAALECRAVVLNINAGHNEKLMKSCRRLEGYAVFVGKIRAKKKAGKTIEDAVGEAIEECIREGVLVDILKNHRKEVYDMLLTEYDEQAHIQSEKEISREEGWREGHLEGQAEGRREGERKIKLYKKLREDNRIDDLLRALDDAKLQQALFEEYGIG